MAVRPFAFSHHMHCSVIIYSLVSNMTHAYMISIPNECTEDTQRIVGIIWYRGWKHYVKQACGCYVIYIYNPLQRRLVFKNTKATETLVPACMLKHTRRDRAASIKVWAQRWSLQRRDHPYYGLWPMHPLSATSPPDSDVGISMPFVWAKPSAPLPLGVCDVYFPF